MKFWKKVRIVISISAEGSGQSRIVLEIMDQIMVLPHLSANCERVFSTVNLNKTKVRNKLSTNPLMGLLHCKCLPKSSSEQNVRRFFQLSSGNTDSYQQPKYCWMKVVPSETTSRHDSKWKYKGTIKLQHLLKRLQLPPRLVLLARVGNRGDRALTSWWQCSLPNPNLHQDEFR